MGLNSRLDSLRNLFAIAPDDDVDLATETRSLYLGASGDVAVILAGDSDPVTLVAMAGGIFHPIAVTRVLDTGTTATGVVGAY